MTLDQERDELAQKRADSSISPHTTIYDVRAGWNACLSTLKAKSPEFDEKAAKDAAEKIFKGPYNFDAHLEYRDAYVSGRKDEFDQMAARVSRAEQDAKNYKEGVNYNQSKIRERDEEINSLQQRAEAAEAEKQTAISFADTLKFKLTAAEAQLREKEHPTFTKTIAGFHAEWVVANNKRALAEARVKELEALLTAIEIKVAPNERGNIARDAAGDVLGLLMDSKAYMEPK